MACISLALAAPAAAQDKPAGNDCQNVDPIAGSVEYRLAALALRGNAQTYGAVAIVDDRLLTPLGAMKPKDEDDDEGRFVVAFGMNQTYGVLDVPTVEQSGGCPRELKYSYRPLDMAGMSFGVGYRQQDWGLFYSNSLTYSFLAADNAALRGMISASAALGASYGIFAAPLLQSSSREAGVVSFNADYVIGGMYDFGLVTAAVGYVGSQGLYARLGGVDVGGFVSGVFDSGGITALELALGPFDLGFVSPTLYGNRRALVAPGITDDQGRTDSGREDAGAWSVVGTELRDLGGSLDLRFTWMFEPELRYSEIIGSIHSQGYHQTGFKTDAKRDDFALGYRLFAGVLGRPTMRYYDVEGGAILTAGGEMRAGGEVGLVMSLAYNDRDRMTLFPYAEGHWAFDYGFEGSF